MRHTTTPASIPNRLTPGTAKADTMTTQPPTESEYVSVRTAAHIFDRSVDTMYRMIDDGEIQAYRLGSRRSLLVRRADLYALLTPVRENVPA